jgi:hypothetical protein
MIGGGSGWVQLQLGAFSNEIEESQATETIFDRVWIAHDIF